MSQKAITAILICGCLVFTAGARSKIAPAPTSAVPASLSLVHCFSIAQENNASVRIALAGVRMVNGESVVSYSRLLPHLDLIMDKRFAGYGDSLKNLGYPQDTSSSALSLQLRQRLLEFGPTRNAEYSRLQRRREALYANENTLTQVLSSIRITYFSLRIIQDQLQQHDSLYGIYALKLEQNQTRLDQGVGLKADMLTARLNCLEERERILNLQLKRHEHAARLKEVLGFVRTPDSVALITPIIRLDMNVDSCVSAGMRSSTAIADAQEEARVAMRQMVETGWDVAPDVSFSAGLHNGPTSAGFEVSNNISAAHQWSVDLVGRRQLNASKDLGQYPQSLFGDSALRYSAALTLEFPLFQGGRVVGHAMETSARYQQARNELIAATRDLERRILEAYYAYQTSLRQLAIQEERVAIDRERYSLAETMREMGKIYEDGLDSFRKGLFASQDQYYAQQFTVLLAEESLRVLIRKLD